MPKHRQRTWLLLILLAAVFLRFYQLADVPPGLTHDEADHGLDAWGVVNGVRPIYFTVGYGREPLFDYSTALLMSFLGPTYLAGRLTAVFYSLILIAGTYAWVRRAFGERTALLTAAGLALSFWPVMTARHALRSVTLPAVLALAIYFYWRGLENSQLPTPKSQSSHPPIPAASSTESKIASLQSPITNYLVAGLLLGLSFYTYLPARLTWLIFPVVAVYLTLFRRIHPYAARPASSDAGLLKGRGNVRPNVRRVWLGTLLMLLVAAAVGLPLFRYLLTHPAAETRVEQLTGPLAAVQAGDWQPLLANVAAGLRLISFTGDSEWRYNLPGKPFLPLVMSVLFYLGVLGSILRIAYCVFRSRQYAIRNISSRSAGTQYVLAFVWLFLGLLPALLTGRALSTTRAIAAQPAIYLFVALGIKELFTIVARLQSKIQNPKSPISNLQSPSSSSPLSLFLPCATISAAGPTLPKCGCNTKRP